MIKAESIDRDKATFPWAAIQDAKMRNAVGITHFTADERRKANAMMYALQLCYRAKDSHINWRDGGVKRRPKFAAIKFEDPTVVDRKNLNILENGWKTDPDLKRVTKRVTPQGVLYRAYF
jgi:hypothetical protein